MIPLEQRRKDLDQEIKTLRKEHWNCKNCKQMKVCTISVNIWEYKAQLSLINELIAERVQEWNGLEAMTWAVSGSSELYLKGEMNQLENELGLSREQITEMTK